MTLSGNKSVLESVKKIESEDAYNDLINDYQKKCIDSFKDERHKEIFHTVISFFLDHDRQISSAASVLCRIAVGEDVSDDIRADLVGRDYKINFHDETNEQEKKDFTACINATTDASETILADHSLLNDELGKLTKSAYVAVFIKASNKRLGGNGTVEKKMLEFMYTLYTSPEVSTKLREMIEKENDDNCESCSL